MPQLIPFKGIVPTISPDAWVADNATLIGDVHIAAGASVWFGCVLRGDVGPIRVGEGSNIQDLSCLHTTGGYSEVHIGSDVTVGHGCIVHGARVGDRVLVGMGSILLDNADIGDDCVVGAGSLVTARTKIEPGMLVMGRPAKALRPARDEEKRLGIEGATHYQEISREYAAMRAT